MKNKFYIGVGSQRAGSTLLHKILDEGTNVYMHPVKELHYFDTLYNIRHDSVLKEFSKRQLSREIKHIVDANDFSFINKKYKNYIRTNSILSSSNVSEIDYLDLYRPCVKDNQLLGEITPEYMLLDEAALEYMRNVLGKDTVIILVMRDPVDRLISANKLKMHYGKDAKNVKEDFSTNLKREISSETLWLQRQDQYNDYEGSINRIRKFFDNLKVIKYDSLYTLDEKRLSVFSEYLGVDVNYNKYIKCVSAKVNHLAESSIIDSELNNILENRYLKYTKFYNEYVEEF